MRKRSIFFTLLFVVLPLFLTVFSAKAQQTNNLYKPDTRLYQIMDKAYLDQLQSEQSELVVYYNYYLDNCYYTAPLKGGKAVEGIDITTVKLKNPAKGERAFFNEKKYDKSTFNPMKYDFSFGMGMFTTYIWKSAGIAIICRSSEAISTGYNEYLKSLEIKK